MLRPRFRIPRAASSLMMLLRRPAATTPPPPPQMPAQARSLHEVPTLQQFPDHEEEGVPGLLSPDGFHVAWTQYMDYIMDGLNKLTAGTEFDQKQTQQIVKETARQPGQAAIFNYASMAYNHNFFFEQLARLRPAVPGRPAEEVGLAPVAMPERLSSDLARQFGSLATLRLEMLATADAMFGPGFVWLVKVPRSAPSFRVLATYLAGTPFMAAHWRRQGVDLNTRGLGSGYSVDAAAAGYFDRAKLGAGAPGTGRFDPVPGGTELIPLLCLSTWQHVYLRDWGVASKKVYAAAWWDCVDWEKVYNLAYHDAELKR